MADRAEGTKRYFEYLSPLTDVIQASTKHSAVSKMGRFIYQTLLDKIGPELDVLRVAPFEEIRRFGGDLMAEGIRRLRGGEVTLDAGYDGEYGKVHILNESEISELSGQISMLAVEARPVKTRKAKNDQPFGKPGAHKASHKNHELLLST